MLPMWRSGQICRWICKSSSAKRWIENLWRSDATPRRWELSGSSHASSQETEREAYAQRDRLLTAIPAEGVGVYLSHNAGYDFSTLPERFTLGELHAAIIAGNASPVGFVRELAHQFGSETEISRAEFFDHGLRFATSYDQTLAGTAAQVADRLEEAFEATGSRGGFMLGTRRVDAAPICKDRRSAGARIATTRALPPRIPWADAARESRSTTDANAGRVAADQAPGLSRSPTRFTAITVRKSASPGNIIVHGA